MLFPVPLPCSFGGFHTIHTVPSALSQPRGSKTRSLRSPRMTGGGAAIKGLSLPTYSRASTTLPRMSARQLQQAPLPHHTPAFLRPKSLLAYPNSPNGKGFPLASQTYSAPPPPLPPRGGRQDSADNYMNDLPQKVAEQALDGESPSGCSD